MCSRFANSQHQRYFKGHSHKYLIAICGWMLPVGLTLMMGAQAIEANETSEPKIGTWTSLFNGENLDGWTPKIRGQKLGVNFGNTFRVENKLLVVRYDEYDGFKDQFGHLFYKQPFSHYRLRVEYRFVGEQVSGGPGWALRNSGIMIHGQPADSITVNQKFPVSIEVQLLGGAANGNRPTANLCTPGTHVVMDGKLVKKHCISSSSETYRGEQWVLSEVEVHGNRLIKHLVNGKSVLEYSQPQLDENDADAKRLKGRIPKMLEGGSISLQSESHPVDFRKVEIMLLHETSGLEK